MESNQPAADMTPEQVTDYCTEQHTTAYAKLIAQVKKNNEFMQKMHIATVTMLLTIIELQGKELALFKELEHHISKETLNEELFASIIGRLTALRQEWRNKQTAAGKEAS